MNKVMGILLLLVYICVATALLSENFAEPFNLYNILRRSSLYGIIGIGVAFVIITGGIDLSIGSMIGLLGCILPMLLLKGWSVPVALLIIIGMALLLGLGHGLLITKVRLQPFVVTLCGLLIYRGVARWISGDQTQNFGTQYNDSLRLLAIGRPCSVPFFMLAVGGVLTLWSAWRTFRTWQQRSKGVWVTPALAGLFAGLALIAIGGSRFLQGYEVTMGDPLISLGGLNVPTWSVVVPDQAAQLPGFLMSFGGLAALPFVGFLGLSLIGRDWKQLLIPIATLAGGAVLVLLAHGVVRMSHDEFAARIGTWIDPASSLAEKLEMGFVFVALAVLMVGVAGLWRRSISLAGDAARGPLIGAAFFVMMFLLSRTRLGETMVPAPSLFLLVIAIVAAVFLNQTIYGRYLLALGRNEEAARLSGIQTNRMIVAAYVICALMSGIAAILFALNDNSIQPSSFGNFYELYAIAAAVLGGCSLRGGEGSILGVVIGAAIMRVLYNAINILGIPSQLEFAIIGVVILVGVIADEAVKRIAARKRSAAVEV